MHSDSGFARFGYSGFRVRALGREARNPDSGRFTILQSGEKRTRGFNAEVFFIFDRSRGTFKVRNATPRSEIPLKRVNLDLFLKKKTSLLPDAAELPSFS